MMREVYQVWVGGVKKPSVMAISDEDARYQVMKIYSVPSTEVRVRCVSAMWEGKN